MLGRSWAALANSGRGPWASDVVEYPNAILDLFVQAVDIKPGPILLPIPPSTAVEHAVNRNSPAESHEIVTGAGSARLNSGELFDNVLVVQPSPGGLPRIDRRKDLGDRRRHSHRERIELISQWLEFAASTVSTQGRAGVLLRGYNDPMISATAAAELVASRRLEAVIAIESGRERGFRGYYGSTMFLLGHELAKPDKVLFLDARRFYQTHGPSRFYLSAQEVQFLVDIVRLHRVEPPRLTDSDGAIYKAFPNGVYRDVPGLCVARGIAEILTRYPVTWHPAFHVLPFVRGFNPIGNVTIQDPGDARPGDAQLLRRGQWGYVTEPMRTWGQGTMRPTDPNAGQALTEWLGSMYAPYRLDRDPNWCKWVPDVIEEPAFQAVVAELHALRDFWPQPVPNLFDAVGSGLGGWAEDRSDREEQIDQARAVTLRAAGTESGRRRGSYRYDSEEPSQ